MAKIQILDRHTAELIAAGEVVERPASVAKELLENAVDAGAARITLSIRGGGIAELQISDDGCGIEAESLENAFIRHATSKISTAADLAHIHTLGFRGEALASIASVARVELLTRTAQDEFASLYRIAGGEPQGLEAAARPVGTTVTVRDLFYNTPARMKFLKKDASEGTFVAEAALHAALSHPEISFCFVRDGRQQFLTPGDGSLRSAVYATLGREFARDLLDVAGGTALYRVQGLITPPRAGRGSRSAQHFFVNGRYVKNRTMMAALENAYKGTLMQGRFPGAVLMLTLPAELVDVNVHPAKTEVRFARESDVFEAVYGAVRAALAAPGSGEQRLELGAQPGAAPAAPARAAAGKSLPPQPQKHFGTLSAAEYRALGRLTKDVPARALPGVKPAPYTVGEGGMASPGGVTYTAEPPAVPRPAQDLDTALHSAGEALLDILPDLPAADTLPAAQAGETLPDVPDAPTEDKTGLSALPPEQTALAPEKSEPLRLVGEVFKTYIVTERGDEVCLIDKHAAHERLLYEKLAKSYGDVPAQLLLTPVPVPLSAAEKQAVLQNLTLLRDAGIEAEDFGDTAVLVRAVPADIPPAEGEVAAMLTELAARLAQGGGTARTADAVTAHTEWVLHSIACRAAVKGGDRTTSAELLALAQNILDGTVPPFCPHGRPCVLKLTRKELEKQFGRLV